MHEALLYEKEHGSQTDCKLCNFYCRIPEGQLGACRVRLNEKGTLYSLSYGKSTGLSLDPIEKKPFYHFHPGSKVLSFGTPGCNFRCLHCQNYFLSQSPREVKGAFDFKDTTPEEIAETAVKGESVDGIAYTYSEPTIFFEYARDTVLETRNRAKEKFHVWVSNGYFSQECFDAVRREKLMDAVNIDLKGFTEKFYQEICGGKLEPVKESIERVFKAGVHVEVTYLVIPTKNDSMREIKEASSWLSSISPDIPLHFSRFYPLYKLDNVPPTPVETLLQARDTAKNAGLNYVYVGNVEVSGGGDTACPRCGAVCVSRRGFAAESFMEKNKCPNCGMKIAGVFE